MSQDRFPFQMVPPAPRGSVYQVFAFFAWLVLLLLLTLLGTGIAAIVIAGR